MKEAYDPELYRALERHRAFMMLNTCPNRPGKSSNLIENQEETGLYLEGVMVALDLCHTQNFQLTTDTFEDAMQAGDTKTLLIFAEAAEDVRRAREEGITDKAKHVVSLLYAKLSLERRSGELPTKSEVIELARELFSYKWKRSARPIDDYKSWKDFMDTAELGYLPRRAHKAKKHRR